MKETEHLDRLVRTAKVPVRLWVHSLKLHFLVIKAHSLCLIYPNCSFCNAIMAFSRYSRIYVELTCSSQASPGHLKRSEGVSWHLHSSATTTKGQTTTKQKNKTKEEGERKDSRLMTFLCNCCQDRPCHSCFQDSLTVD